MKTLHGSEKKFLFVIAVMFLLVISVNTLLAGHNIQQTKPIDSEDYSYFDSLNVRFVGNFPFGRPFHVAYDSLRNLAFLSSGGGVYILDVSNPSNPAVISDVIRCRDYIHSELFYDSNTQRLYIAVERWFEIWDVSNPNLPSKLSSFVTSESPVQVSDIYVSGTYAYCFGGSGFSVVDVSSPQNPQIVGEIALPGGSVAVKDSFAYVLADGFHVIDISDPENPEIVAFLWQFGGDISVFGSYAFISSGSGLYFRIIDISDPHNPQFAGYFDSPEGVYHAHVIGTIAYLSTELALRVVDISDPMNPQELGFFPGRGRDIFVRDTLAYFVDIYTGLRILNVSTPSSPHEIATYVPPGISNEVCISGSYAYVTDDKGLWIIDVSDQSFPREVGRCYTTTPVYDISLSGSYAYTTTRTSGLVVFDISDPSNPGIAASLNLPLLSHHYGLDISGHYCYVANGYYGLKVVDISNPLLPYVAGQCSLSRAYDVEVSGLYAYVISAEMFTVIDITDPSNPYVVGMTWADQYPSDICVSGMNAFVTDSTSDVSLFDISDPYSPQEIFTNWMWVNTPSGIDISGLYAYISKPNGISVYNISQPDNPISAGYYHQFTSAFQFHGVSASGTYAYASTDCGLQIYQFYGAGIEETEEKTTSPLSFKLLQNPTRGNHIELLLHTTSVENATICLHNVAGQRVKTFTLSNLVSGKNRVTLSTDRITSGIYFLRLGSEFNNESIKVTIIR